MSRLNISWIGRDLFRQSWPLLLPVLSIAATLIWRSYLPFPSIDPLYYDPRVGERVDYWALIAQSNQPTPVLPLIPFLISIPITFSVLIGSFDKKRKMAVGLSLALAANAYSFMTFCGAIWVCGANVEHQQTIEVNEHNYHYAFMTNAQSDCDWLGFTYLVFECDVADKSCQTIYVHPPNYPLPREEAKPGKLVLDESDQTLYFQIGGITVYSVRVL